MNSAALIATTAAIYDYAVDPACGVAMLQRFNEVFACHFADSFRRNVDYSHWHGIQAGLDEQDYQDVFLGVWTTSNVWGRRRPPRTAGDVITTRDMASSEELKRSAMYRRYLGPRDLHEGLRLDVWAGEGWVESVSLLRSWSAGPFLQREQDLAHQLMPHLRRAGEVRRRLQESDEISASSMAALETLRSGVMLFGTSGRLLHANQTALSLLRSGDGLRSTPDGIAAATPGETRLLHGLLLAAAAQPGQSGSMRLTRPSGGSALSFIVLPVGPRGQAEFGLRGGTVLACIVDPDSTTTAAPEHLTALFGLTPSEASLAGQLLTGLGVREIAALSGRSIHTVRSVLARLLTKTETGRQSDLMRLLTRLPGH